MEVEHIGSAHTDAELGLLLTAARERLHPGQGELDLGLLPEVGIGVGVGRYQGCRGLDASVSWGAPAQLDEPGPEAGERPGGRRPVVAGSGLVVGTASLLLWDVLEAAYYRLGFSVVADEAFKALVLARIIEPAPEGRHDTPSPRCCGSPA